MTETTLIALTGPAGSGKDTAAAYLVQRYGFAQASFAEPIRQMLFALFEHADIDHAYITEPARKNTLIPELGLSARVLMQTLGTEWGRKHGGADFWVNILKRHLGLPDAPVHDRIVISDVRFLSEAAMVTQMGGVIWSVQRPLADPAHDHQSERHFFEIVVSTPPERIDLIDNGDTLGQLHTRIDALCHARGITEREGVFNGF